MLFRSRCERNDFSAAVTCTFAAGWLSGFYRGETGAAEPQPKDRGGVEGQPRIRSDSGALSFQCGDVQAGETSATGAAHTVAVRKSLLSVPELVSLWCESASIRVKMFPYPRPSVVKNLRHIVHLIMRLIHLPAPSNSPFTKRWEEICLP